jgi:hypothetical protein
LRKRDLHSKNRNIFQQLLLDRRLGNKYLEKIMSRTDLRVAFREDPNSSSERGGNIAGYRGARMQRGYGIGGVFKSLARYAIPLFKQGDRVVGKRALQAATEIGQDVLQGKMSDNL